MYTIIEMLWVYKECTRNVISVNSENSNGQLQKDKNVMTLFSF